MLEANLDSILRSLDISQRERRSYKSYITSLTNFFLDNCPGVFRHQFTAAGRYCYWSDFVDQYKTTWFRGCVTVEDLSSNVAEISVKVNGFEAIYDRVAPQCKYLHVDVKV